VLLECVPNVSEGRKSDALAALERAFTSVPDLILLDRHRDADHNRTVFTAVGGREALVEGAFSLISAACRVLDINEHRGVHPRMGSVDVCPFVPIGRTPMSEAVRAARELARRVAEELEIPVFLYGEAALREERKPLPKVRPLDSSQLAEAIAGDPKRAPDFGPPRLHPRFGAVAVGARPPLVAYNIDLQTTDLALAGRIADRLRESSGGLKGVRALAFPLSSRRAVQVSCNLTEGVLTPLSTVFKLTSEEAARAGVKVLRSELAGLVPRDVLYRSIEDAFAFPSFGPENVLEDRILRALPLLPYVEAVADPAGGPGGGAVSAAAAALGSALASFVASVRGKDDRDAGSFFAEAAERLALLENRDREAYENFRKARSLPKGEERNSAVREALREACLVPIEIMETALETLTRVDSLEAGGSIGVDVRVAARLLAAAAECARDTLAENLKSPAAGSFRSEFEPRSLRVIEKVREISRGLLA